MGSIYSYAKYEEKFSARFARRNFLPLPSVTTILLSLSRLITFHFRQNLRDWFACYLLRLLVENKRDCMQKHLVCSVWHLLQSTTFWTNVFYGFQYKTNAKFCGTLCSPPFILLLPAPQCKVFSLAYAKILARFARHQIFYGQWGGIFSFNHCFSYSFFMHCILFHENPILLLLYAILHNFLGPVWSPRYLRLRKVGRGTRENWETLGI